MNLLEKAKLDFYKQKLGEMTVDEAFQIAMESEQFKKDVGPFDQAFEHFAKAEKAFLEYAALLEKEQTLAPSL